MTTIRAALTEGPTGEEARLCSLLDAYGRYDALLALAGLADIHDELQAARDACALEVAALVMDVRGRGGSLTLGTRAVPAHAVAAPPPPVPGAGAPRPVPLAVGPTLTLAETAPDPGAVEDAPPPVTEQQSHDTACALAAPLAACPRSPSQPPAMAEVLPEHDSAAILTRTIRALLPSHDPEADIASLDALVGERGTWGGLPDATVVKILVAVAGRLRALQERGEDARRVDRMFTALTGFSETRRPGFAWGLSRSHQPTRGAWVSDADAALDALTLLLPIRPLAGDARRRVAALQALVADRAEAPEDVGSAFDASIGREVRVLLDAGVPPHHPELLEVIGPVAQSLPGAVLGTVRRAAARFTSPPAGRREHCDLGVVDRGDG